MTTSGACIGRHVLHGLDYNIESFR